MAMRIDAHLHFWQPTRGFDNRPVADNAFYRREFTMDDVVHDLALARIDAAVLVQTCPQVEETRWMLDIARDDPRIVGVTGWVDLDSPAVDYTPLVLERKIVGIRAQLRRVADDAFVLRPRVKRNMAGALDAGLSLTLLAEARHYPHLDAVLDALPDGAIIFNHLAMPTPQTPRDAWKDMLSRIARRPRTYVQLSGLPFLFGDAWQTRDARSMLDDALDILGTSRLLFASDWPMLLRFASYAQWVDAVEQFLERRGVDAADRDAIFGRNLARAMPRLALAASPSPSSLSYPEPTA